jgi:NADH-quinone oxidoreductase subunit J
VSNIFVVGESLYTFYAINFLLAGYVLLIAMIGAIFLTLHHRQDVKRQIIFEQIDRVSVLQKLK